MATVDLNGYFGVSEFHFVIQTLFRVSNTALLWFSKIAGKHITRSSYVGLCHTHHNSQQTPR